jgi:hypothetical protein
LAKQDPRAGTLYETEEVDTVLFGGVGGGGILGGLIETYILDKGILTDQYDGPVAPSPNVQLIHVPVNSLSGNTAVTVDDRQPWPIAGTLTLTWVRASSTGPLLSPGEIAPVLPRGVEPEQPTESTPGVPTDSQPSVPEPPTGPQMEGIKPDPPQP